MGLDRRDFVPLVAGTAASSLYFYGGGKEYLRTVDYRKVIAIIRPPSRDDHDDFDSGNGSGPTNGHDSSHGIEPSEMVIGAALFVAVFLLARAVVRRNSPQHA